MSEFSPRTSLNAAIVRSLWMALSVYLTVMSATSGAVSAPTVERGVTAIPAAEIAEDLAGNVRRRAMDAYDEEDYEKALDYLREAYSLNPLDAEIAGRLGFAAKETGAYELALSVLEKAVELRPDEYYHWWWLSDVQRLLGRYRDALKTMERARDLAPADVRTELQEYVAYTAILADNNRSWENYDQHLDFADRHRNLRRVRRQIEEYANALDVAPEFAPGEMDALARLSWTHQQMGVQYNYIEEPDVAVDYFLVARAYAEEAGVTSEVMRNEQFLAISFRMLADRNPETGDDYLKRSARHWRVTLELAQATEDVTYQRYSQGRLLETLSRRRPMDDPELVALREANLREVPWQGPINEYSLAEAVVGEAFCRMVEEDFAGARVLFEMALPYYEESKFLSDYQRAVELYLALAWAYYRQGHPGESLNMTGKAMEKATQARQYVDADAFNRGAGEHVLRHIAAARARAYLAQDLAGNAFSVLETYKSGQLLNLLGSRIIDDAKRTDARSEESVVRRRIPMIETRLEQARAGDDAAEMARIEGRLAADHARLAALETALQRGVPTKYDYRPLPPAVIEEVRTALGDDAALLSYLFDSRGGVALAISGEKVLGFALEATERELCVDMRKLNGAQSDAEIQETLDRLSARLVGPILDAVGQGMLIISPDANVQGLAFDALRHEGDALLEHRRIAYADTAARLTALLALEPTPSLRLRAALGRTGATSVSCDNTGIFDAVDCLRGAELSVALVVSDVQQGDVLHLACTVEQAPLDIMSGALRFGEGEGDKDLAVATLLGMALPASLVVLDWEAPGEASGLRDDMALALIGALHYAGARSVLTVAPMLSEAARNAFFGAFYGALAEHGKAEAVRMARRQVMETMPGALDWTGFHLFGDYR